jgi:predicted phage terminase large subunit-like protein
MKNQEKSKWEKIVSDPEVRKEVARNSHLAFFHIYLAKHVKYKTAPFQRELFALSEDEANQFSVIESFRGSAKSTIMNLSYSIWSIIGKQKHKFVLILAQTQNQSRQYLSNIKKELEDNELLRADFGPFEEPDDEWRNSSIVLPKYDARIMAASLETPVRGLKHKSYRPSLIIIDDLEDLSFVKSRENRDKAFNWLFGDVIPMGEINTRVVVIGTRLHDDSLIMRIRNGIEDGSLNGIAKRFPIIDDEGKIAWSGKYKTEKSMENLKKTIPTESGWQREYMLKIVPDDDPVVRKEWIKYYESFPGFESSSGYAYSLIGIDLAIREGLINDYTAMVTVSIYDSRDGYKVFVHPNPINSKMDFPTTIDTAKMLSDSAGDGQRIKLVIESVAYQVAAVQQLTKDGYPAVEYQPHGNDKYQRLSSISPLIFNGTILFPENGCELLIRQLINFGQESHDDLVDALTTAILKIIELKNKESRITIPDIGIQPPIPSQKALEEETVQLEIARQEIVRSGGNNPMALARLRDIEKRQHNRNIYNPATVLLNRCNASMERYKKAAENEEKDNFRKMMRGY